MNIAFKSRVFALTALVAVVLGVAVNGFAVPPKKKAKTGPALVSLLPESDAAMTVDVKRALGEAMPQILAGNKKMLADILRTIAEMKDRTGIDVNQFEEVAVGMSNIKSDKSGIDFDAVMLARGTFNAASMFELAKKVGTFREEKVGERTLLVFSLKDNVAKVIDKADKGGDEHMEKLARGLDKDMAVTVWDTNTLLAGSLDRVRAALGDGPKMGADVVAMVSRNPRALMSFGGKLPSGLAEFLPLDADELGDSLKGIRQMSGWLNVAGGFVSVSVGATTADPAQAKNLHATLTTLKNFAGILKASKRADQQVYGKMIENVKLAQSGSDVTIDLSVAQSDMNIILGSK